MEGLYAYIYIYIHIYLRQMERIIFSVTLPLLIDNEDLNLSRILGSSP